MNHRWHVANSAFRLQDSEYTRVQLARFLFCLPATGMSSFVVRCGNIEHRSHQRRKSHPPRPRGLPQSLLEKFGSDNLRIQGLQLPSLCTPNQGRIARIFSKKCFFCEFLCTFVLSILRFLALLRAIAHNQLGLYQRPYPSSFFQHHSP